MKKPGLLAETGLFGYGLAVTYFRMRKRHTIIGANPFHGPVRDGKAWFQAAIAARLSLGSKSAGDFATTTRAAIRKKQFG